MNQGTLVSTFNTSDGVTCLDVISHKWQAVCGTRSGTVYKFVIYLVVTVLLILKSLNICVLTVDIIGRLGTQCSNQ